MADVINVEQPEQTNQPTNGNIGIVGKKSGPCVYKPTPGTSNKFIIQMDSAKIEIDDGHSEYRGYITEEFHSYKLTGDSNKCIPIKIRCQNLVKCICSPEKCPHKKAAESQEENNPHNSLASMLVTSLYRATWTSRHEAVWVSGHCLIELNRYLTPLELKANTIGI